MTLTELQNGLEPISGVRSVEMTTVDGQEALRVDWKTNPYNHSQELEALGTPQFSIIKRETNHDQLPIVYYAEPTE